MLLRLKLMLELRSIGKPFSETCKRFQQVAKTLAYRQPKNFQMITPLTQENLIAKVKKTLVALVTIYQYLTKISEDMAVIQTY